MRSSIAACQSSVPAISRMLLALVAAGLLLGGCSGGSDGMTGPQASAPAVDLDTTKAPPQTVTSTPLLPPMPEDPVQQRPASSASPEASVPLQYDHLYTDDEQVQIKADLAAAAARVQKN